MTTEENKLEILTQDGIEEKPKKPRLSKEAKIRLAVTSTILLLFIGLVVFVLVYFWPYIKGLLGNDEETKQHIIDMLSKYGSWAWLILLLCLILQVVLAVLPNGAFEIVAGLMYGPYLGSLLSLVGSTIGCLIVIYLVKAFGTGFAKVFVDMESTSKKFKILDDEKRCLVMMFGYLFIPGLPKDFVAFIVPFTKVHTYKFLIVNIIARTPATIVSVFLGNSLVTGNFSLSILLAGGAFVIGILCMVFNKQIINLVERPKKNKC